MNFRALSRRAALAVALALAVMGLVAGAASAQSPERIDGKYGYVTFDPEGDVVEATDIWDDGYGVRARLKWEGGSGSVTDYSGLYGKSKRLSIPEGTTVYLTMCYTNNGHAFNCSEPQSGEA
jgi:hypothetical protein